MQHNVESSDRAEVVFVLPFWSQSDAMNFDSNYAYLRRVLPALSAARPGWLWVVAWPEAKGQWRWQDDGLFRDNPRLAPFSWPYDTAMRSSVLGFDPHTFHQLEERWAPTIYWLHQVESGAQMMGGYRQSFNASGRPFIVAQHHYIIHESLPYQPEGLFPRLWLQMGGTLAADRVVVNSQHTARMLRESFGSYLTPKRMGEVNRKLQVLPFGLIDAELAKVKVRPSPHPIVVYNHRFEQYKQPGVTADVLRRIRSSVKFDVWATQSVDQKMGSFPLDRLVGDPDHGKYIDNIAVQAVNTLNSVHETFCISALDSLMLGHLLVAPRSVTFPELVPPDYPYLFNSTGEQEAMLRAIFATWPAEVEKWGPKVRKYARDTFALDRYVADYLDVFGESRAYERDHHPKPSTTASLNRFFGSLATGDYGIKQAANLYHSATGMQRQAAPMRRVVRDFTTAGARVGWREDGVRLLWESS